MLALRDLHKSYGQTVAVDGLSLEIRRAEVFGLLGPNGAGKSTTINMAVGLTRPDSGTVIVDGQGPPTDPGVRALIGVAPQSLAVYDELTGTENLRFFGKLYGLAGRALAGRVEALLALVGLGDRAGHRVKTYSGGMKRRLNLAAALVHDPPLLMLDEPTAGVDPQSRSAIFDIVRSLRQQGRTVVYTTHYMEEAQRLCDRVAIIDRGRVLALDTVDALISAHGGKSALTVQRDSGEDRVLTDDPVRDLSAALQSGGHAAPVRAVRIERPDLETVFLSLTGRTLRD
jgi:ABC-2 type transport system ATP-binding protein